MPLTAFLDAWSADLNGHAYGMLVTADPATGTDAQAAHALENLETTGVTNPPVPAPTVGHGSVLLPIVVITGAGAAAVVAAKT